MLAQKGLKLDAVDRAQGRREGAAGRASRTAPRETVAAGGTVRTDDNPDAFKTRLDAYREQTAPVSRLLRDASAS